MNRSDKLLWIAVLKKNSRTTCFHDLKSCRISHACSHHEDFHCAMAIPEVNEQTVSLFGAEVVIEQNYIGWRF